MTWPDAFSMVGQAWAVALMFWWLLRFLRDE